MMTVTTLSLIAGIITFLSLFVIVLIVYSRKKSKRASILETPINTQLVTNSAPISRRTSLACLINLENQPQRCRSRSASFSEDLTARLQNFSTGSCYRSYAPTIIGPSSRPIRLPLSANTRFPIPSNTSSKPTIPSITFQLRYEHTIETLFITIFQLQNYLQIKNSQNIFLILYLLPNDDEQRQTQSSTTGLFNENFHFLLKSDELSKRTLRLTVYVVDSTTRIRNILGHVFLKFNQFIDENNTDKTFSTNILSEYLIQDLQIRSNYLGELILTNTYLKEQNLIQIRIQEINHFNIDSLKTKTSLKAYFSGQTSNTYPKHHWTNTSTFIIPSSSSFRIDQELNLTTRSSIISTNEDSIECHLRLHLNGFNQIHSHARWQYSLRSDSPNTLTVPLIAL